MTETEKLVEAINKALDLAMNGCTDPLDAFRRGWAIGTLVATSAGWGPDNG